MQDIQFAISKERGRYPIFIGSMWVSGNMVAFRPPLINAFRNKESPKLAFLDGVTFMTTVMT
jgi:hypothetical protein